MTILLTPDLQGGSPDSTSRYYPLAQTTCHGEDANMSAAPFELPAAPEAPCCHAASGHGRPSLRSCQPHQNRTRHQSRTYLPRDTMPCPLPQQP